ncbi:MAG: glycosyltransferase family 4 protein [Acidobacteriota bacterium]
MRLALVVQRYGSDIRGGAELHCRLIAEHLAERHQVAVVTTCAQDYLTWANAYSRGISDVNGVAVWRFPVRRLRDPGRFGHLQERVFHRQHTESEAMAWLAEQGPFSPSLRQWVRIHRNHFDYWICFSYRYWTTFQAMREAAGKTILVPTAEPDPAIEMPLFRPLFRGASAIVFNSYEERTMILDRSSADEVPADIIGVGIQEPTDARAKRFLDRTGIAQPFILYIGRIDENKGCRQLFDYFIRACQQLQQHGMAPPHLVLAGQAILPIPEHPLIHHLGAVEERDKYDALAAATALIMPSFYESLSMVLLEAWALQTPVLVNGQCEVLRGQVSRSSGGLYYKDGDEFREALRLMLVDKRLCSSLGTGGQTYYANNYAWPVIEAKYERLLEWLTTGVRPTDDEHSTPSTKADTRHRNIISARGPS